MSLLLVVVLLLPLAGALLTMLLPREEEGVIRGVGLVTALVTFAVSLLIWKRFDTTAAGFQLVVDKSWIPGLGARLKMGVDGISLWLVLLTTFLTPIVLLSATRAINKKVKEFIVAFLILETGMLGAFLALDLFFFYVMWEVMLIPMYFIIGVWGGDRRVYASIKFVIYTMVGSLLMLVAIFYLYIAHNRAGGGYSFDLESMYYLQLTTPAQLLCFCAFALAFAIKVPLFPFHTWLPDAHVEAPTAGSVILAGVLLKFGIYGFLRFAMPLFPNASHQIGPWIFLLGVVGIVYGAMVAYAQDDVKKLIAYSSVSHLGFCVIGAFALNTQGIQGSIFAALSHGLTTSGLFLAIGVLYERRHTRKLAEFGGLWAKMPVFAAFFLIVTLGSAGLPGLSGFVGEFLALVGSYDAGRAIRGFSYIHYPQTHTAVAATGVILGAVYLLYMFQKVMFGPLSNPKNQGMRDLTAREIIVFIPIIVGVFVLGIYPKPVLNAMQPAVENMTGFYAKKLREPTGEAHFMEGAPIQRNKSATPVPWPAQPGSESGSAPNPNLNPTPTPTPAPGSELERPRSPIPAAPGSGIDRTVVVP
jgi:NADH-quinone oxidoreductase subunit M